ncbi:3-hydroxybutyryl-CoA dehydrogenase [Paenibacillus montaniterrae]|uniref:3-hydroxybutyryl-CoA dehydrogenase n=1 Tax=Paenibacillus montaniterrae TaxID=429341 RepID=A0A919YN08_9BACL|nr:3-hydroxyacyl-CoA dehydrogenase family protein [Paenibacillus montaniterrae]GIP15091.1 3-hydroxybutyryl-CoA dehydrogenase [Paenibacillus montaniterrae]
MIKKVGVVGVGTMGQGLAEMLAKNSLDVYILEKSQDRLEHAMHMIEVSLDKQIEKWAITSSEKKLIISRINPVTDMEKLSGCELIIESINEELEDKKEVFKQLDQITSPSTILASNTSSLSLTEIASVTRSPERVIGMHFVHPVATVNVVEVVRGLKTSEQTVEAMKEFADVIQKKAVMVFESPGFVTTRLICLFINEALHVLEEGVATAEDIDQAMRNGYSFKYGPFQMADHFGLDSVQAALENMFREYGELKYRPSFVLKKMVRAGQLGVKTGMGFFKYDTDGDRI